MEEIITKLETLAIDIRFDIDQDWNTDKFGNSIQVMKIESAIALLKSVGENGNITK